MKKIASLIFLLLALNVISQAQSLRAYEVGMMAQHVTLFNIVVPPAADEIKSRAFRPDGSEMLEYANGTRIILNTDDTIEKFSADRKVRQVFVFKGDKTEVKQYYKTGRSVIITTFAENKEGNFVPENSKEIFE